MRLGHWFSHVPIFSELISSLAWLATKIKRMKIKRMHIKRYTPCT